MTKSTSRSRLAAAVSPIAFCIALAAGGGTAWAQDSAATEAEQAAQEAQQAADEAAQAADEAAQAAEDAQAAQNDQSIVVTGFRASLQSAINTKKRADQIVESVSAEEIGKLPDASIGEAIARLPGLTSQRLNGRADVISVRGFGPDFSTTLLNGREQTSTGDNRAVEYDQYPSEVISQVNIYKTPMASIIGQGIAGTVDLRTIRPLEYGKRVITVGVRGVYPDLGKLNPDVRKYGYRVNAAYIDQFADGRVGVSLAGSWTDEPYEVKEFNSWGYADAGGGLVVIGGAKPYSTSTELKRLGLAGTVEFKPTDSITSTIDGFYSNFKDDQIKRGIEIPLWWGGQGETLQPGFTSEDGVITDGAFDNMNPVVRNVAQPRHAKLYSFGWNTRYDGDNGWHGFADVSYSKTNRNELIFETYAGLGSLGSGPRDVFGFHTTPKGTTFDVGFDYSDPDQVFLTDPRGWGGPGYYNNRIVHDRIWQYQAQISKDFENSFLSKFRVGGNWTNHDKSLTPDEFFVRFSDPLATEIRLPDELALNPVNLNWLGLGHSLAYDPNDILDAGIYTLVPNTALDVAVKAYSISENLGTIYAQADIDAELGSAHLTGNVGIQAVHTKQSSSGFTADRSTNALLPFTRGASYWDVMPSLNLSARFPSDFVIRLGLAREVMRPRLDDMRAAFRYGVTIFSPSPGVNANFVSGDSGNPELRPFRANAADLSFEKYWGVKGYIAAQLFYKYFDTFVVDRNLIPQPFDFTGFPLPQFSPGVPWQTVDPTQPNFLPPAGITNGEISAPYNIKGGKMYGVELAATVPFGDFVSALDGFGMTGGVSYTKSKIEPYEGGPSTELPGYSKWVANGTLFFEKWGFSARGSVRHRSSFLGEVSGFGANRTLRRGLAETIFDGQIGYEFQPGSALNGLSVYLQGLNLTDEPFVTEDGSGNRLRVIDYQRFGRRWMAGATFRFGARAAPPPAPAPVVAPPPPPPPPATQTCVDGSVILATEACPAPPPPPPPPPPAPERG